MSSPPRSRWIIAGVLLICIAIAWWVRRRPQQPTTVAYVADRAATLWSTTAEVRHAVATLGYGERVMIASRSGDQVRVRTDDGAQGWLDSRMLMDAAMWQRVEDLLTRARALPVQAIGHTRALSNVRLEPGRDAARIFQFGRDVPVAVLQRKTAPAPQTSGAAAEEVDTRADDKTREDKPKQEDWLLVLGTGDTPIAGWVLGRFIDLQPPAPIPDYTSAAGMRVVAWAVLSSAADASGPKPQYLVAGVRGGEGQVCDFTMLRVYTWDAPRQRYETAFIDSDLCGSLPIRVSQVAGETEFRFAEIDERGEQRVYRMKQTVVRRVRETAAKP